jgi:S1-C subfamily serine protease
MSRYDLDDDPPPPRRRPRQRTRPIMYLLMPLLGAGIAALGIWLGVNVQKWLRGDPPPVNNPDAAPREATPKAPLDPEETEAVNLFKGAKASVVNVDTVLVQRGRWDERDLEQQTGSGSGFVWDNDGRVVTNFHVVQEAKRRPNTAIRVVTADRRAYDARVVGEAPDYDLAVVQIVAPKDVVEKLPPITVGTSGDLEVGQKAYAIGNPFGLSLTMTKGIISALDRTIEAPNGAPIAGTIQIDAAINPGNSGGPLLDRTGRLIGVNSAIRSPSGGNVGIGFAIPVDTVNRVVTEMVQRGRPLQADLGVKLYDQTKLRRAGYPKGVMIAEVTPGGAAAKAGLLGVRSNPRSNRVEPGDLILAVNGTDVAGIPDFQKLLAGLKPGAKVKVKYLRNEQEQETTLVVGGT